MNTEIDAVETERILTSAPRVCVSELKIRKLLAKIFLPALVKKWPKIEPVFSQVNDNWFTLTFAIPGDDRKQMPQLVGEVDRVSARHKLQKSIHFKKSGRSDSLEIGRHSFYGLWIETAALVPLLARRKLLKNK